MCARLFLYAPWWYEHHFILPDDDIPQLLTLQCKADPGLQDMGRRFDPPSAVSDSHLTVTTDCVEQHAAAPIALLGVDPVRPGEILLGDQL